MHTVLHTPLPWVADKNASKRSNFGDFKCSVTHLNSGEGFPGGRPFKETVAVALGGVKDDRDVAAANAAFIVRACNAHDELVAAAHAFQKVATGEPKEFAAAYHRLSKALAVAEGR